jgi:hypothetical protein
MGKKHALIASNVQGQAIDIRGTNGGVERDKARERVSVCVCERERE